MNNDEIIGGYKPEQVISAYNDIAQLAPRTAAQPAAMQAILRRRLANQTEPFEIKEITDLEKGLKDTQTELPMLGQQNNKPNFQGK